MTSIYESEEKFRKISFYFSDREKRFLLLLFRIKKISIGYFFKKKEKNFKKTLYFVYLDIDKIFIVRTDDVNEFYFFQKRNFRLCK